MARFKFVYLLTFILMIEVGLEPAECYTVDAERVFKPLKQRLNRLSIRTVAGICCWQFLRVQSQLNKMEVQ